MRMSINLPHTTDRFFLKNTYICKSKQDKMGFLDKKFRVRVKHFYNCRYVVQYAYYRFIPIWHTLKIWFGSKHPGDPMWIEHVWMVDEAENVANSLKSIEDVKMYYKPYKEQEANWKKEEDEYWEKHAPYNSKEINP